MSMRLNGVARVPLRAAPTPQLIEWPSVAPQTCGRTEPSGWPNDPVAREMFEERAAILEFDGGLSRDDAEIFARRELKLMPPDDRIGN